MSESHATAPGMIKPQFTATMLLEKHVNISFRELQEELRRAAPEAVLGDWAGPVTEPDFRSGDRNVDPKRRGTYGNHR